MKIGIKLILSIVKIPVPMPEFKTFLLLIPLLLLLLVFVGFKSYKFKINRCNSCGSISLGLSETCMNCGADLDFFIKKSQSDKKPSESTIEVEAEEIK